MFLLLFTLSLPKILGSFFSFLIFLSFTLHSKKKNYSPLNLIKYISNRIKSHLHISAAWRYCCHFFMLHSSICCVYAGPQHQFNRDAVKWLRLLRKSDKFLGKILFILNTLANLVATHTHTDLCSYSSSKQRSLLSATPASYLLSANSAVLCSTHGFVIPKSSEWPCPAVVQLLHFHPQDPWSVSLYYFMLGLLHLLLTFCPLTDVVQAIMHSST